MKSPTGFNTGVKIEKRYFIYFLKSIFLYRFLLAFDSNRKLKIAFDVSSCVFSSILCTVTRKMLIFKSS